MPMQNTGSCLCGKITFAADKFLPRVGHCHCKMCQKFHGAAFSTFVEVKLADFHWLTGHELLTEYQAENQSVRKFCRNCGSSLVFESKYNRADQTLEIALASFDQHQQVKPDAHIYVQSKVQWFELNDNLPKYLAYRE